MQVFEVHKEARLWFERVVKRLDTLAKFLNQIRLVSEPEKLSHVQCHAAQLIALGNITFAQVEDALSLLRISWC